MLEEQFGVVLCPHSFRLTCQVEEYFETTFEASEKKCSLIEYGILHLPKISVVSQHPVFLSFLVEAIEKKLTNILGPEYIATL